MESLKSFHDRLKNLESQGKKLIKARLALNTLFTGEETRLKREDEVSILRVIHRAIVEQLQQLKQIEASASCGHSQGSAVLFMAELAATAIVAQRNRTSAIKDYLLRKATDRKESFGLVMVCIEPEGLPDGARAVSISQLARESNRTEREIMNKLQDDGHLFLSEKAFSLLIDRLIDDVREGKLRLPLSRDKVAEITELNIQKLRVKIIEIE